MGSGRKVRARSSQSIDDLCKGFSGYCRYFENSKLFVGPSLYFHQKTIALRRRHRKIDTLLRDEMFFDCLYATLTAWGMHRMGPGNTKLRDIAEVKGSLREHEQQMRPLEPLAITDITENDASEISGKLWSILSRIRISQANAKIVAASKALHHVLPSLIPPIDRSYTLKFFYGRGQLSISEKEAFKEIYLQFHRVAQRRKRNILARLSKSPWNTSETKVIDNGIVGFVLKKYAPAKLSEGMGEVA